MRQFSSFSEQIIKDAQNFIKILTHNANWNTPKADMKSDSYTVPTLLQCTMMYQIVLTVIYTELTLLQFTTMYYINTLVTGWASFTSEDPPLG